MSRSFRYYAEPEEVREYLTNLGYPTQSRYDRDGKTVLGFIVPDTTVGLDYDHVINGTTIAYGSIHLSLNDPYNTPDSAKRERSQKLYQKLYRRFRKPGDKV